MSYDLVNRLREEIVADAFSDGRITNGRLADRLIRERLDAADEIERLRGRLAIARDDALEDAAKKALTVRCLGVHLVAEEIRALKGEVK